MWNPTLWHPSSISPIRSGWGFHNETHAGSIRTDITSLLLVVLYSRHETAWMVWLVGCCLLLVESHSYLIGVGEYVPREQHNIIWGTVDREYCGVPDNGSRIESRNDCVTAAGRLFGLRPKSFSLLWKTNKATQKQTQPHYGYGIGSRIQWRR